MKNLKTLGVVLLTTCSALTYSQNKKSEKAVIKTAIYCDDCQACGSCGKRFQTEMLKIKGVRMYELNESEQTITVYYNPKKTNLKTIKTKITQFGFDADDLKAEPIAYEKLAECCKK